MQVIFQAALDSFFLTSRKQIIYSLNPQQSSEKSPVNADRNEKFSRWDDETRTWTFCCDRQIAENTYLAHLHRTAPSR
jgi:hypothetical protein